MRWNRRGSEEKKMGKGDESIGKGRREEEGRGRGGKRKIDQKKEEYSICIIYNNNSNV